MGDIEGLALLAGSSSNDDESDIQQGPFLQSPREDAEHPNGIFQEPSGMQTVVENSDTSKLSKKIHGCDACLFNCPLVSKIACVLSSLLILILIVLSSLKLHVSCLSSDNIVGLK